MVDLKELSPDDLLIAAELLQSDNEGLQKENELLKEANDEVRERLIKLAEKCTDLESQLDLQETTVAIKEKVVVAKPTVPKEPVTVNGRKYKFRFPRFSFNRNPYTAEEAQFDTALLTNIIARKGQTILIEIL